MKHLIKFFLLTLLISNFPAAIFSQQRGDVLDKLRSTRNATKRVIDTVETKHGANFP